MAIRQKVLRCNRLLISVTLVNSVALLLLVIFSSSSNNSSTEGPICVDGMFDRQKVSQLKCQLHHYQLKDVAACFDQLSLRRSQLQRRPVQIAFIGESTVRNQFKSLLRLIPDYDMKGKTETTAFLQHHWWEDRNVTSQLLNLQLNFYWSRFVDDHFIKKFIDWNTPPHNSTPDFILMGTIIHHMSGHFGIDDIELLAKGLEKLKPILQQLSKITRIVWLIQAPGPEQVSNDSSQYFSAKIPPYNKRVRSILEGSGVELWDSGDTLAMEYSRSCAIQNRLDIQINRDCRDAIHHGYVVLQHSSQTLVNEICNRFVLPHGIDEK